MQQQRVRGATVPEGRPPDGVLSGLARVARRTAVVTVSAAAGLVLAGTLASGARAVTVPVRVAGSAHAVKADVPPTAYPFDRSQAPLDEYGFVAGECTSFAAWWLNTDGVPFGVLTVGPSGTGRFLNASTWDGAARAAGWTVGTRPVVGAVAQWHAGEKSLRTTDDGATSTFVAGRPGHVAVVVAVLPDGTARWLEYGWAGKAELHTGRGTAPRYLYVGVTPPR